MKGLLLLLALIMGVTQAISIYWIWHESQEQLIRVGLASAQNPSHSREELRKEEKETMGALYSYLRAGGLGLLNTWDGYQLVDATAGPFSAGTR